MTTTTDDNDGGMDKAGLAMLVAAVEANVDAASAMHNKIVANEQRYALGHAQALIDLYDAVIKATEIISIRALDDTLALMAPRVESARRTVERLTETKGADADDDHE